MQRGAQRSSPVVDEHVEDTQERNQEASRVLCLEAHSDHDARAEPDDRDEHASKGPVALEDEADKEEDEQDSACELEAGQVSSRVPVCAAGESELTTSACQSRSCSASPQRASSCWRASRRGP